MVESKRRESQLAKHKGIFRVAATVVLVVTSTVPAGCATFSHVQEPRRPASAEAAIREVLTRFEQAFERRDAALYASSFTEDADWENSFGGGEKGRAAIEKRLAGVYTLFQQAEQKIEDTRIWFITADVAVAETVRSIAGSIGSRDQTLPVRRVRTTAVLRNENGSWRVVLFRAADLGSWAEADR